MHGSEMQSMQGSGTQGFWRGRRVFLTGHTGFKGGWMSLWLTTLGAKVTGYALAPAGARNLWSTLTDDRAKAGLIERSTLADIRDRATLQRELASADPQVVIHMAAQALVRESYRDPVGTFDTNVLGTAHLLEACRALERLECVVVVTSDKVYENAGDGGAPSPKATASGVMTPTAAARHAPSSVSGKLPRQLLRGRRSPGCHRARGQRHRRRRLVGRPVDSRLRARARSG